MAMTVARSIGTLAAVLGLAAPAAAQEAAGDWHGVLAVAGTELRVGVTIVAGSDGALSGVMTSPDQSPAPIPLDGVVRDGAKLAFAAPRVGGRFEAAWDADANAWVGTWSQGLPLPLTLYPGGVVPVARPQLPIPPFPYREEEVAFDSAPGVRLAGTLTLPEGKGPFPAVVLITGSGPQDRDETLAGHKPFLVLADALTRRGVAVLRYDDRGVGASTGRFPEAAATDFAADVRAALAYLRTRAEADPRRTGLIGHSEGGMIAPMVAADDPRVAFVVLMAGPGVPAGALMAAQRQAVALAAGATPEAAARNAELWARVDAAVSGAPDLEQARTQVRQILSGAGAAAPVVEAAVRQVASTWYRQFLAYDPAPNLRKLRVPVLALNGDKDLQVVSSLNLPGMRAALKDNPRAEVVELPGLNHLFQPSATGDPREYGRIEQTMAPAVLQRIGDWILRQAAP
jgi:pimeloyl-ACP methyl ester carboxylesterase